eukprot:scaffold49309_cov48-Cyclotella_meneghiniana.AAC.3
MVSINPRSTDRMSLVHVADSSFPVDHTNADELYKRSSELGSAAGHYHLGKSYRVGTGIGKDRKKSIHHFQIAAMMGHVSARHNVGGMEWESGNDARAMRHFMIAAKSGHHGSLEMVKSGFKGGTVMKKDLETTLRSYQASLDEMRSEDRDRAKAAST